VRLLHRLLAYAALVLAVMAAIVGSVLAARAGRARTAVVTWCIVTGIVPAVVSGFKLPWDQLALWAVRVDESIGGYRSVLSGRARFVLQGSHELTAAALSRLFWLHTAILPLVLGALWVAAFRTRARKDPNPEAPPAAHSTDASTLSRW
jgi:quinol-cytochrome oxidoreductase complex cytochrome b subunit